MKFPAVAAFGAISLLAFLGEMNQRGYYGSALGYRGSGNIIADRYKRMSTRELENLAAAGDRQAASAYEQRDFAWNAFNVRSQRDNGDTVYTPPKPKRREPAWDGSED